MIDLGDGLAQVIDAVLVEKSAGFGRSTTSHFSGFQAKRGEKLRSFQYHLAAESALQYNPISGYDELHKIEFELEFAAKNIQMIVKE